MVAAERSELSASKIRTSLMFVHNCNILAVTFWYVFLNVRSVHMLAISNK